MPLKKDLYQTIAALSPNQRKALAQQLYQFTRERGKTSLVPAGEQPKRLVGYVVGYSDDDEPNPALLRAFLQTKLPHYQIPTVIVPLKTLPRTASGKIDIRALPEPSSAISIPSRKTEPRNPTEEILVKIWRDVLRIDAVGIQDNYFELGGDSILSIQIVSKAREAGLRLAPNQLFEQPTIAQLASAVNLTPVIAASQEMVTGVVPLTPIQHWFFEQRMVAPHHWHQAMLLELPAQINLSTIEKAIATLWDYHDALRLRFTQHSHGWQQACDDASHPPSVIKIDLSQLSLDQQIQAISKQGSDLHCSGSLADGRLMSIAHLTRGTTQPSWLLLSLHHLLVDAVSWQILSEDLIKLVEHPEQQDPLPAKTTSFKVWAETLKEKVAARASEAEFWFNLIESPTISLPQDSADTPSPTEATAETISVSLNQPHTQALLQSVPAVYHTKINDVLLTALAQAVLRWVNQPSGQIRIDLESHGREMIDSTLDLSRTVGWFTTLYPVNLNVTDRADWGATLKSIKEQLRQIPDRGIGYGLLRYLGDESTRHRLAEVPQSEILFNYLGKRDRIDIGTDIRVIYDIDYGQLRDSRNQRCYRLEINAWVTDGKLQVNWIYDTQAYRSQTISILAETYLQSLEAIITHCQEASSGGFTPSDFPDVDFSQGELEEFMDQLTQQP